MGEHVAAQIRDHPLAQRGHEIVARRRRQSDDEEINVDCAAAVFREAEIDHPAQREGHRQGRDCRHRQGGQRRDRPPEMAPGVAHKVQKRAERGCLGRGLGRHGLFNRRFVGERHGPTKADENRLKPRHGPRLFKARAGRRKTFPARGGADGSRQSLKQTSRHPAVRAKTAASIRRATLRRRGAGSSPPSVPPQRELPLGSGQAGPGRTAARRPAGAPCRRG